MYVNKARVNCEIELSLMWRVLNKLQYSKCLQLYIGITSWRPITMGDYSLYKSLLRTRFFFFARPGGALFVSLFSYISFSPSYLPTLYEFDCLPIGASRPSVLGLIVSRTIRWDSNSDRLIMYPHGMSS